MKRSTQSRLVKLGRVTTKTKAVAPPGTPELINPSLADFG